MAEKNDKKQKNSILKSIGDDIGDSIENVNVFNAHASKITEFQGIISDIEKVKQLAADRGGGAFSDENESCRQNLEQVRTRLFGAIEAAATRHRQPQEEEKKAEEDANSGQLSSTNSG